MEIYLIGGWIGSLLFANYLGRKSEQANSREKAQAIVDEIQNYRYLVRWIAYSIVSDDQVIDSFEAFVVNSLRDVDSMINVSLVRHRTSFGVYPQTTFNWAIDLGTQVEQWIEFGDYDDLWNLL